MVFQFGSKWGADAVANMFKGWAKAGLDPSLIAPMTKDQKDATRKLAALLTSDEFQKTLEASGMTLANFVDAFIQDVMENTEVELEVRVTEETGSDVDNSSGLYVSPEYLGITETVLDEGIKGNKSSDDN